MARQPSRGRRAALEQPPRGKGGGLFLGMLIGLIVGLLMAAGIAWYLNSKPGPFKTADRVPHEPEPLAQPPASTVQPVVPSQPATRPKAPQPEPARSAAAPPPAAAQPGPEASKPAPAKPTVEATSAASAFTFFDILPGEKPAKPAGAKLPREVWWLQVAALREAKDADRLKARLTLLGLSVQVQPVTSGETTLHRVRVGPFKTEDEALGALDTLAENNYEPRLFKEKLDQP